MGNLVGNSCRKILQEIVVEQFLVGNCCGKILQENCCGKILREIVVENLAGKSCGKIM